MHRCGCSTRALEAFIKDFAAISVRKQRAQRFSQQQRAIGTRPPLRLQAAHVGDPKDDFVPFTAEQDKVIQRTLDIPPPATAEVENRAGDGEWHAEVTITLPNAEQPSEISGERNTDIAWLRSPPEEELQTTSQLLVLDLPAISQHLRLQHALSDEGTTATAQRTRQENRLLRKQRRVQEGTFGALAKQTEKAKEKEKTAKNTNQTRARARQVDILQATLDSIDRLEDPSTVSDAGINNNVEENGKRSGRDGTMKEREKKGRTKQQVVIKRGANATRKAELTQQKGSQAKERKTKNSEQAKVKTSRTTVGSKEVEPKPKKEDWQIQKAALERKFGDVGWQPRKRVSPDTLEGIRALHASDPATYTTPMLAEHFKITPEAIRRILKSKWKPKAEEAEDRMKRWERRGVRKWEDMSAQGSKPPKKWRELGVPNPTLKKKWENKNREVQRAEQPRSENIVASAERLGVEGSLAERIL